MKRRVLSEKGAEHCDDSSTYDLYIPTWSTASCTGCDRRNGERYTGARHGHDEGRGGYGGARGNGRYESDRASLWRSRPACRSDSQIPPPGRSAQQGGSVSFAGSDQALQTGGGVRRKGRSRGEFESGNQGPCGSTGSDETDRKRTR